MELMHGKWSGYMLGFPTRRVLDVVRPENMNKKKGELPTPRPKMS